MSADMSTCREHVHDSQHFSLDSSARLIAVMLVRIVTMHLDSVCSRILLTLLVSLMLSCSRGGDRPIGAVGGTKHIALVDVSSIPTRLSAPKPVSESTAILRARELFPDLGSPTQRSGCLFRPQRR